MKPRGVAQMNSGFKIEHQGCCTLTASLWAGKCGCGKCGEAGTSCTEAFKIEHEMLHVDCLPLAHTSALPLVCCMMAAS